MNTQQTQSKVWINRFMLIAVYLCIAAFIVSVVAIVILLFRAKTIESFLNSSGIIFIGIFAASSILLWLLNRTRLVKEFVKELDKENEASKSGNRRKTWSSIESFAVVIPFSEQDLGLIETPIKEVLKIRNALMKVCQTKYLVDPAFLELSKKQEAGNDLSEEETEYMKQANVNYLEMVCDKMEIALLYTGNWFDLSLSHHNTVYRVAERYSGCSVVSSLVAIGNRRKIQFLPSKRISDDEAKHFIDELVQ